VDRQLTQLWLAGPEAAAAADRDRFDAADRERAARLAGRRKEAEWLASRALRQRVATVAQGITSLSHAAGHAALAVGPPECRLGVDLEAVTPRDVLRLAKFSFTPAEAAQLETLPGVAAMRHFYLLWTLKEACAKALGLPLFAALRECRFLHGEGGWRGDLPCDGAWRAATWRPRPGLVLSAVVLGPSGPEASWQCLEWPGTPAAWAPAAQLASGRGRR